MQAVDLWTVDEAAAFLKLHPETVREKARARELPAVRLGLGKRKLWRFDEAVLREWVAQGCPSQADQPSLFEQGKG